MKRFFSCVLAFGLACSGSLAQGEDPGSRVLGGACDTGCVSCDDAGYATCECGAAAYRLGCGHSGWYAGVEATYLAPLYDNGPAGFALVDDDVAGDPTLALDSDFDTAEELTGAPRVVLGYTGKRGIGIQARYWELNNGISDTERPVGVTNGFLQSLGGEDSFEAYTIDLELTKEFCRRGWDLLGTFGVRHASIDHTRAGRGFASLDGDIFSLGTEQSNQFNGTGLTASLSGVRPLRRCRGLAFYATGRSSVVFGEADTLASTSASIGGAGGVDNTLGVALVEEDDAMFITEIGAGLQWSRCVRDFKSRMFARIGVEYQYWDTFDDGAVAVSNSSAGTPGVTAAIAAAQAGDHEFHLIGLSAMTGFNW